MNCESTCKRKRDFTSEQDLFTVCASINVFCGDKRHNICSNRLYQYQTDFSWEEVYHDLIEDEEHFSDHKTDVVSVTVANTLQCTSISLTPDFYEKICVVKNFDPTLKYVTFKVKRDEGVGMQLESNEKERATSVNDFLMKASAEKKQASLKDPNTARFTAKDGLYNDVVTQLNERSDQFPKSMGGETISGYINMLVGALWYISGNMGSIMERACHTPDVVKSIPERFLQFDGRNDYKKKKQKKPVLSSKELKLQSEQLFRLASKSFTQNWKMKEEIEQLALSLNSYATYLDKASDKQTLRQSQSAPVRQVDTHLSIKYISKVESVGSVYNRLDLAMSEIDEFEPLFFDEDIHLSEGFAFKSYEQRYKYLSDLALSSDIHLLHYDPGGSLGAVCFMWKISSNMSSEEVFVADTQILSGLRLKLPEFHTRKMRKDFATAYENIAGITIPPHVLRSIYTTLTNDATSYQNPELDQRMRLAVLGSEPDLVVDMRHLNKGRPGNTFDQFFDVLEKEVESFVAADERRHNVEHISQYLSVRDLIEQVKQKLPDDTPIPSEATVLLAFVPKNSHAKVSKLYKGRVPLRLKVQTRQLRASHADDHYCAALFKYMKQYAVKHRDEIKFVCMDDKSKIDFGEPGMFSSSGVRGKKSIVPMNSSLSCLDHDVQSKGSLTPSVVLDVDIPNSVEETFYQGEVSLTMKDSVFQPSNPFRHVVELKNILDKKEEKKPVLFMYTDGGPDHKVTFHSVKLSLIVLFKKMGLEFLVACRTAPGHSWANPAERIMSVLNIAFQNTALAREEMNSEMEQNLRSCSGMNDIRKKAEKIEGLKGAWLDSLTSVENLLEDRVKRLQLKGKQFCTHPPASDDILEQAEAEVTLIDNTISVGKYQQQQVSRADRYKKFLVDHCRERHYSFQVRRCLDASCCPPGSKIWAWLPDPVVDQSGKHHKPFESVLGTDTTEKDRPSSLGQTVSAVAQDLQGCKNSVLVGQNVRWTVKCCECEKPRCIYAKQKFTPREQRSIKHLLERYDYSCGSVITPDGDALQGRVFVRLQLSCQSPVEFPYYASGVGRPNICAHCASEGAERDRETLKHYKIVLPVCQACIARHKDIPKRNPINKK